MTDETYFVSGHVVERGVTTRGSPKIKLREANGTAKWYYPGKCDVSGMKLGDEVVIEGHSFQTPNGPLPGLDRWDPVGTKPPPSDIAPGQPRFPTPPLPGVLAYVPTPPPPPYQAPSQVVVAKGAQLPPLDSDQVRLLSNCLSMIIQTSPGLTRVQFASWFNQICASLKGQVYLDTDVP